MFLVKKKRNATCKPMTQESLKLLNLSTVNILWWRTCSNISKLSNYSSAHTELDQYNKAEWGNTYFCCFVMVAVSICCFYSTCVFYEFSNMYGMRQGATCIWMWGERPTQIYFVCAGEFYFMEVKSKLLSYLYCKWRAARKKRGAGLRHERKVLKREEEESGREMSRSEKQTFKLCLWASLIQRGVIVFVF